MRKVSIITPVYNGEKYVIPFFESLLNQTFKDFQLIIINDGSIDNTAAIINDYKNHFKEKNIEVIAINSVQNIGAAGSVNLGLKYVNSSFFMWLDADDLLTPDSLEKRIEFMENNPSLDLCICDAYEVIYPNYKKINRVIEKPCKDNDYFLDVLQMKNVLWTPGSVFCKTSFLKQRISAIYESKVGQNIQLLLPLLYQSTYEYMNIPLYIVVAHNDSDSRKSKTINEQFYRCQQCYVTTISTLSNMNLTFDEFNNYSQIALNTYFINMANCSLLYGDKKLAIYYYDKLDKEFKRSVNIKKNNFPINILRKIKYFIKRMIKREAVNHN